MKKVSQRLWFTLPMLASFVLLQACAIAPKLPDPKPGLYVNEEFRFSVEYPENWQPDVLRDDEVLRVTNPSKWKIPVLTATVTDLEDGAKLESKAFMEATKEADSGSKSYIVSSEKMIKLNDGTPALAMTYKWTLTDGTTKLQTATVWAFKNKKSISANATTVVGGDTTLEMLLQITESLKFY